MTLPKILVCGGRDYQDRSNVFNTLDEICRQRGWVTKSNCYGNYLPTAVVIHGGARGAESLAGEWATLNWCQVERYPAPWHHTFKGERVNDHHLNLSEKLSAREERND